MSNVIVVCLEYTWYCWELMYSLFRLIHVPLSLNYVDNHSGFKTNDHWKFANATAITITIFALNVVDYNVHTKIVNYIALKHAIILASKIHIQFLCMIGPLPDTIIGDDWWWHVHNTLKPNAYWPIHLPVNTDLTITYIWWTWILNGQYSSGKPVYTVFMC